MGKYKSRFSFLSCAYWRDIELQEIGAASALKGFYETGILPLDKGTKIAFYAFWDKIVIETINTTPKKTYNLSYSKINSIQKSFENVIESTPTSLIHHSRNVTEKYCVINYTSNNEKQVIKFLYDTAVVSDLTIDNESYLKVCDFFDFVGSRINNAEKTEITDL